MDTLGMDVPGKHQGSVGSSAPEPCCFSLLGNSKPHFQLPGFIPFLHRCLLFLHNKAGQLQFQAEVWPFPARGIPEEIMKSLRISFCAPHSASPLRPGSNLMGLLRACLVPQSPLSPQPGSSQVPF